MGEVVSFRKARKASKKREENARAESNRIVHGRSKEERSLETARREQAGRMLDAHKIDSGDA